MFGINIASTYIFVDLFNGVNMNMKCLRNISLIVITVVFSNVYILEASATPVTTSFDTTVKFTSGIAGVNEGDGFSGSFTYDNDQIVASSSNDFGCGFGIVCTDPVATFYRFSDLAYAGNVSTSSFNHIGTGVYVNVFNDHVTPSGFLQEQFTLGMLSSPETYDLIVIGSSYGGLGLSTALISPTGELVEFPEMFFGVMFVGNSNLLTDTALPLSIEDIINSPDFIGTALSLSRYELQEYQQAFPCVDAVSEEDSFCLGGVGEIPVQTGYIYGEEVNAIPTPATLLLIAPGLLVLMKLTRKED